MAIVDTPTDVNCALRTSGAVLFNPQISQNLQVGGVSPDDYELNATANHETTFTAGWAIGRFKSNFVQGTDTKSSLWTAAGGPGAFPLQVRLFEANGEVGVSSNPPIVAGTSYVGLFWWINDLWKTRLFDDQTYQMADLLAADAGTGTLLWPPNEDFLATAALTASAVTTAATSITVSGSIVENAAAGTVYGQATANRQNGDFGEGVTTPSAEFDITTGGQIVVATGQTAPAAGTHPMELEYDNTAAGGGVFSTTAQLLVTPAAVGGGGKGASYIPIPVVNSGQTALTPAQVQTLATDLTNDWTTTVNGFGTGLNPTTDDVVIQVAAGSYGDFDLTGVGPFPNGRRLIIRGAGPGFGHDGWVPTAPAKFERLKWTNCDYVDLMGVQLESESESGFWGVHVLRNSTFCRIRCNSVLGRVSRSLAHLQTAYTTPQQLWDTHNSSDLEFENNVMAGSNSYFGSRANKKTNCPRVLVRGNLFTQSRDDIFQFYFGCTCPDWIIEYNMGPGHQPRYNNRHPDFTQISQQGPLDTQRWIIRHNLLQTTSKSRMDTAAGLPLQGNQSGTGATQGLTKWVWEGNHFGINYKCLNGNGAQNQSTFTHNTLIPTVDMDVAAENNQFPTENWNADGLGFAPHINPNMDWNFVCGYTNNATTSPLRIAGPNGLYLQSSGFQTLRHPDYDWSALSAHLKNFSAAVGNATQRRWDLNGGPYPEDSLEIDNNFGINGTASPRRLEGVRSWEPLSTSRLSWEHNNPCGAFRLYRRWYHLTEYDHQGVWGWPTRAAMDQFDRARHLPGAPAGTYAAETYDANGA